MQRFLCTTVPRRGPLICALAGLAALAACAPAPATQSINDPNEAANREVHEFNKSIDRSVIRWLAAAMAGEGEPGPVTRGVANFADNLNEPTRVVNSLFQLRIGDAAQGTLRFVFNSTIGLGGVLDPSTALGIEVRDTDFGETLHVWGFGEGAYVEVPLKGPSTERDVFGDMVDYVINPTRIFLKYPESLVATVAAAASNVSERGRYSDTVDSILYDSADSYAQARLLYLQNRRFELGQTPSDDSFEDPYAE